MTTVTVRQPKSGPHGSAFLPIHLPVECRKAGPVQNPLAAARRSLTSAGQTVAGSPKESLGGDAQEIAGTDSRSPHVIGQVAVGGHVSIPDDLHRTGRSTLYQGRRPEASVAGILTVGPRNVPGFPHRGQTAEEQQLRMMCEQIGQKASEKFRTAREAFRYLDSDKDGRISRGEMRYFFLAYNFPKVVADRFFDFLDVDGSQHVDYDEFLQLLGPYIQPEVKSNFPDNLRKKSVRRRCRDAVPDQEDTRKRRDIARDFRDVLELIRVRSAQKFSNAREVFNFVDVDYNGTITYNEMEHFFRKFNLPTEKAQAFFDRLDEDGSGDIEYMEFLRHVGPYIELPGIAALMS